MTAAAAEIAVNVRATTALRNANAIGAYRMRSMTTQNKPSGRICAVLTIGFCAVADAPKCYLLQGQVGALGNDYGRSRDSRSAQVAGGFVFARLVLVSVWFIFFHLDLAADRIRRVLK